MTLSPQWIAIAAMGTSLASPSCGGRSALAEGVSGSRTSSDAAAGTGGRSASGGAPATGGSGASGGWPASGGAAASGGVLVCAGAANEGGSGCPETPPTNGCPCPKSAASTPGIFRCSWGDDARPYCRTAATCLEGKWSLLDGRTLNAEMCSAPLLPPDCPVQPQADGAGCAYSDCGLDCWYGDGTNCACLKFSFCAGSSEPVCSPNSFPSTWYCAHLTSGCPVPLPQAGSPCGVPDLICQTLAREWDYSLSPIIECEGGVWQYRYGSCPTCAAPDTPIATPNGDRAIASLRVGDLVYSVDHDAIVAVPLLRAQRTLLSPGGRHHVMRVLLQDGHVLRISPGHPTSDGRPFATLNAGSALDAQHTVVSAELVRYKEGATYDVLPASDTGTYFAAGALIGSTLFAQWDCEAGGTLAPAESGERQ